MEALTAANDGYNGQPETVEHMVPGYSYDKTKQGAWRLWVVIPTGVFSRLPIGPEGWSVEEHEDGTISVTPSIWNHGGGAHEEWHGYLTRDEYVSC